MSLRDNIKAKNGILKFLAPYDIDILNQKGNKLSEKKFNNLLREFFEHINQLREFSKDFPKTYKGNKKASDFNCKTISDEYWAQFAIWVENTFELKNKNQ